MGTAGPLLRALADADLPDPVPARGAYCARLVRSAGALARPREPARAPASALPAPAAACVVVLLLAQGLVYSVHSGLVLSRADTRNLTRDWMVAHIPRGAKIVVEPVSPDEWAQRTRQGPPRLSAPLPLVQVPLAGSRIIAPTGRFDADVTARRSRSRTTCARSPRR